MLTPESGQWIEVSDLNAEQLSSSFQTEASPTDKYFLNSGGEDNYET